MTIDNATEKEARRAAYATYVECFWSLRRLPPDDARRPALTRETQRAESAWRATMARTMGGVRPNRAPRPDERERAHPASPHPTLDARPSGESLSAGEH